MDGNQLHSHPQIDPEDLEDILKELEEKSAINLTISLPTDSIESSKLAYTPFERFSRHQSSSTQKNTPFFSTSVASENKRYSFENQKRLFDGVAFQPTVPPDRIVIDRLPCANEQLWSNRLHSDTSYKGPYSIISQSVPSFDLPQAEVHNDSRYGVLMEDDAQLSGLPIQHTNLSSSQTKFYYNWKETTDLGSSSNSFQSSIPPAYASTSAPDSWMCPSTSEASDDASDQDDGSARDKAEGTQKGTALEKQPDETANVSEGKTSTSKDRSKALKKKIKRQRGARYALRTRSQVEVMDDGYRWRKYGQKAVKNSPYPRSYYRCTNIDCPVKKRVERSADDAGLVITTYEGVHTHHAPSTLQESPTAAGFPAHASFQRPNYWYQLPSPALPATLGSALAHHQPPSESSHPPLSATRGLLEDMLYFQTPRTS